MRCTGTVGTLCAIFDNAENELAQEYRPLQRDRDDEQEIDGFGQIDRRMRISHDDLQRHGSDKPEPDFRQRAANDPRPVILIGIAPRCPTPEPLRPE